MALPTSPEFTTALDGLAEAVSKALDVQPPELVFLALRAQEEPLEALFNAWLTHDDREFEDDEDYDDFEDESDLEDEE